MDTASKPPTVLSLCTGYGGIELGLKRVFGRINTLAHVEIEAFAIANLVQKMEAGKMAPAPIWTDVKTLPHGPFSGGIVDVLTGGYPCQPFSAAGKRLGDADPRHIWPYIRDTIRAIRPRMCFFENVEGHISMGLHDVLTDLEDSGYSTAWGIFSAAEVGAPHQRKRVFILAHTNGERKQQQSKFKREGWNRPINGREDVADCGGTRPQRYAGNEQGEARQEQWPHRPTAEGGVSPQYDWERPRIIKSGLGRTANGTSHRVDRLRLLGNGVVPQVAEKAFKTLYEELMANA